jgi:DNA replication protein DnaC
MENKIRKFDEKTYEYDLSKGTILKSPRFNKFDLPNSKLPNALKLSLVSYVNNFEEYYARGVGLYLHSLTPGSGKTTLLAILMKQLMKKGYRVYCDSFIEIKNSLKTEFNTDNKGFLEVLKEKDVLAIDDIGSEVMSNWLDEVFKELLDYRYNLMKPTFFTSNRKISSLPFADKSLDRLKEVSIIVEFPEQSFRKSVVI